jgi:serine/threonine protein kinase
MARYKDITLVGVGGNAEVFLCERDTDGLRFAKKKILIGADDDTKDRFKREVRLLAKLDHPNIVTIVATHLEEEPLWFVMPLYQSSLENLVPTITGDAQRISKIFGAVLDAVEHAHAEGVIHRDLKPGNVLLNTDDDIVVSDFGLGRHIDSNSTRLTGTGAWMGTILYMAPEQLGDTKHADERADIFSLGRMLYELMTGRLTSAVQDASGIDPAIALIIARCTRRRPEDRFQTLTELKVVWRVAVGTEDAGSDSQRLKLLLSNLLASSFDSKVVTEILEILARHNDETDLLHDTMMALPTTAIRAFSSQNAEQTKHLLKRFVDHATSQSWPFSYTDKIGDFCERAYNVVTDPEVRADLLHCAIDVGVCHNRWHVLGIANSLLNANRSPAESIALAERIQSASPAIKEWIRGNLSNSKRDTLLDKALEDTPDPSF